MDILAFRSRETGRFIVPLLLGILPQTAGLMLCGIAAWRSGVLREPQRYRRLLGTIFVGALAIGATVVIGTQAFWNMLVVVGAVPTKGLTLPFISYGGSSVVVCLALIGVLDAVAQANVRATNRTTTSRIGAAVRADSDKAWRWQTDPGQSHA